MLSVQVATSPRSSVEVILAECECTQRLVKGVIVLP